MNVGEERRTIYIEPTDESPEETIREPARVDEPERKVLVLVRLEPGP
jgi:hypothetical protein